MTRRHLTIYDVRGLLSILATVGSLAYVGRGTNGAETETDVSGADASFRATDCDGRQQMATAETDKLDIERIIPFDIG